MVFPKNVKLVEVGPRDGLQNEPNILPTSKKIEFINRLSQTGLTTIEVTSFVSAKWVPQLADAERVFQNIDKRPGIHYPVLIPNLTGYKRAIAAGATEVSVFTAASETFCQKNTHCSLTTSLARIQEILNQALPQHIAVRAYLSCAIDCPYEGSISPHKVAELTTTLLTMGCYEVSLGDTTGTGTMNKVSALLDKVCSKAPTHQLAVHFHDTYGQALTNIYSALEHGIATIDCAIGGLGGCPYAPGAGGNVASEDVLFFLNGLGIETGVNLNALLEVNRFLFNSLQRLTQSKTAQAMMGGSLQQERT